PPLGVARRRGAGRFRRRADDARNAGVDAIGTRARCKTAADARSVIVLHRRQCRRQRVRLLRQDGHGPRPACGHRPDGRRRTRRFVQERQGHHGRHRQFGGKQMRVAAAEARRVLVEMAAGLLSTSADKLAVNDGVVNVGGDKAKRISYAQMIGGRYFNVQLDWNKKYGNPLYAPGKAKPKKPDELKIVGQPIKREDVAPKVFCQQDYCTDIKVPGMVHGRMIRPAVAGAVPVKVDESSIKDISGAKVVWDKGFLGVVADREWDAIQAAQKLKVEWSSVQPPFPD